MWVFGNLGIGFWGIFPFVHLGLWAFVYVGIWPFGLYVPMNTEMPK